MKHLIDFIETKDVSKASIFEHLKCTEEEALLIQYLCKRYVSGLEEVSVLEMLQEHFSASGYVYLEKLDLVKNLLDLGWMIQVSFGQMKAHESSKLELLSTSVTPSISLLRLLEEGSLEILLPEIKPYTDHLEYLQDQFDMVALLHNIATFKQGFADNSLSIGRLKNKLSLLTTRIEERVKMTEAPIVVEEFFKEKELDEKEKRIFLALLKEEYSGGEGHFREMNTLIELISFDEYDKIKNRSLLEDGARLISEEIIDYEEILNMFGGVSRSFYLQEEVMQRIIHSTKTKKVTKLKLDALVKDQEIFEYLKPTTTLEDVVLHPKTRETLENVIKQVDKEVFRKLKEWGIKDKKGIDARIIFYGAAGTGKTMTAMSLAKTLKKPILSFDCSKILSMYVGESEKNVRKIFDDFKELSIKAKVEPILLLNEADQFLSSRSEGTGSSADKMHNQMQNIFLEQIEKFEGILIATTNLLGNIDKAFSRRFNHKIEFKKPGKRQRLMLWQFMLPENADYEEGFKIEDLAGHELTGGQINLIIKNTAYKVAVRDESVFSLQDFLEEIEKELGSSFDGSKSMGFKV
ncbi:MAG TPA: ATP-binding protein [Sulfurovum sp.]|nr:MAG: AAA family ATPase [Sulfurovum sp. 35-42-20]OYZ25237.1 MAG: AAA family ATPase [Sulfurovum sp. 16-42-52]OYZ50046.1 MAG: AAA family ATPase [Sulfurovum sp. 24-42-9]OZA45290.1 MAG: AAA family ATPase [Sulfurovum sp. 17-42-90]OZA60544.1 MAG: AAA family ATPase [Sulfurovum sp. 39-42-12]HQR72947.1 ATP-binding protein [Sulfurovum sp.]